MELFRQTKWICDHVSIVTLPGKQGVQVCSSCGCVGTGKEDVGKESLLGWVVGGQVGRWVGEWVDRTGEERVGGLMVNCQRVTLVRQFPFTVDRVGLRYGDRHYQGLLGGLSIGGSI